MHSLSPTKIAAQALDYVQPSAIKIGGVTGMLAVMEHARAAGLPVMPHSPYFGPGLIATLHACAARAPEALIEIYFCDLGASPLGAAVTPVNGRLAVPQAPGLGVKPDTAVLREFGAEPL